MSGIEPLSPKSANPKAAMIKYLQPACFSVDQGQGHEGPRDIGRRNGKGSTSRSIDGTMAFDRKDYGMNSDIPFIKIANRVEVNVSLKWKRVSGPPPVFQQ
jgi:hypothetical protein